MVWLAAAGVIVGIIAIYIAIIGILYAIYSYSRNKIEATCKMLCVRNYESLTTEILVGHIENSLANKQGFLSSSKNRNLRKSAEKHISRYKRVTKYLNRATAGKFKHFL